jgi:hypothetical protein
VGSIPGLVKPKTIKLICVASPLSTQKKKKKKKEKYDFNLRNVGAITRKIDKLG